MRRRGDARALPAGAWGAAAARAPYKKFLTPNEMVLLAAVVKRLDQGLLQLVMLHATKGRHQHTHHLPPSALFLCCLCNTLARH